LAARRAPPTLPQAERDWVRQERRLGQVAHLQPEVQWRLVPEPPGPGTLGLVRQRQPEAELQFPVPELQQDSESGRLGHGKPSSAGHESVMFAASPEFPNPATYSGPLPVPLSSALLPSGARHATAPDDPVEEQWVRRHVPVPHRVQAQGPLHEPERWGLTGCRRLQTLRSPHPARRLAWRTQSRPVHSDVDS